VQNPFITVRVRPTIEGLKVEIVASRSVLAKMAEPRGAVFESEHTHLEIDLPALPPSDDGRIHYTPCSLTITPGADTRGPSLAPEWDNVARGPAKGELLG
jgi:hypothetical protein